MKRLSAVSKQKLKAWLVWVPIPSALLGGLYWLVPASEISVATSVWWSLGSFLFFNLLWAKWLSYVVVVEGAFLFTEHGGLENEIRTVHFKNGKIWRPTNALPPNLVYILSHQLKPGDFLAVQENFCGAVMLVRSVAAPAGEGPPF